MFTYDIKNLKQLECLGYNLQCLERPVAMIYESYRKYAMYYILLFREIQSMYFKGDLSEFVSEKTQIHSKLVQVKKKDIEEYIRLNVEQNKKMIFYSDHFWNERYPKYYKVTHYKHPILMKAYEKNNGVVVIDEDIERINDNLNKYYFWPYSEQFLKIDIFETICGQWKIDELNEGYIVCEFSTNNNTAIDLESILSDYKQMISTINKTILVEEMAFINIFRESMLDENQGCITEQSRKYVYEHSKALNRQFRLFANLLNEDNEYKVLIDDVGNHLKELYESYYLSLTKKIVSKKADIMIDKLKEIYGVEKTFYQLIEKMIDEKEMFISLLKKDI